MEADGAILAYASLDGDPPALVNRVSVRRDDVTGEVFDMDFTVSPAVERPSPPAPVVQLTLDNGEPPMPPYVPPPLEEIVPDTTVTPPDPLHDEVRPDPTTARLED